MRVRLFVAGAVATVSLASAGVAGATGAVAAAIPVDAVRTSGNVRHLANVPHSGPLAGGIGSDLAFQDNRAFVGNYNGFVIYNIDDPRAPRVLSQVSCPGGQNDISVYGSLLFLSTDSSRTDDSCASAPQSETIAESWEGIKIFDISNVRNPRYIKSVETACGSHTHTILPSKDKTHVYLYVSSYSPDASYPDCKPPHDSISIIDVPVAAPTTARVVSTPNLFPDGGNPGGGNVSETTGCHDITVYPAKNIAAGACMGDGIIMDITDPVRPRVIERVTDNVNFAFWHSATFNRNASKVVFTDELGGGVAATCNAQVGPTRGANGIYYLNRDRKLTFASYFKIPRMQTSTENCVAHNGSMIPVEGKDIMVQSWYQGGVSFWDFTNAKAPREIGYFERGPLPGGGIGGTWSAYYYNGHVYSSDIAKGFDVVKINDPRTDPAKRIKISRLNVQSQPTYYR